jgi:hypothetical protein
MVEGRSIAETCAWMRPGSRGEATVLFALEADQIVPVDEERFDVEGLTGCG